MLFDTFGKVCAAKSARMRYMGVMHLGLATMFTGALVAGSDAGKVMNNWPFYGKNYLFPEDGFEREPVYKNFLENQSLIQFMHRSFGYLTYASVIDLWFFMRSAKTVLPYMMNAHGVLLFSSLQVVLGITALMRGSPFYESLTHQINGLVFLSTVLYGLNTFRKPNKEFIRKILAKDNK